MRTACAVPRDAVRGRWTVPPPRGADLRPPRGRQLSACPRPRSRPWRWSSRHRSRLWLLLRHESPCCLLCDAAPVVLPSRYCFVTAVVGSCVHIFGYLLLDSLRGFPRPRGFQQVREGCYHVPTHLRRSCPRISAERTPTRRTYHTAVPTCAEGWPWWQHWHFFFPLSEAGCARLGHPTVGTASARERGG